jgi:hypothetical protein
MTEAAIFDAAERHDVGAGAGSFIQMDASKPQALSGNKRGRYCA